MGIVVDPRDYVGIAEAVAELLEGEHQRRTMAQRGRKTFLSRFNWDAVAPQMLDSLKLLEGGSVE